MIAILQTQRLKLRRFTTDDAEFIIRLLNTRGWIKYIGDRNIKTEEQAKNYLQNGPLRSYELNGYGLCPVELKNKKVPIGMCGIIKRDHFEHSDIGFAFLAEFAGEGFALEIASETVQYAKDTLKLDKILAITVDDNKTSRKLLEKIGMNLIKLFTRQITVRN